MATFQVLIDALLRSLTYALPLPPRILDLLGTPLLGWNLPNLELETLVLFSGSLVFLIFFRFDWLALLSAGLTSIFRPNRLKAAQRTLDQHILLFLIISASPLALAYALHPVIEEATSTLHPLGWAMLPLLSAGLFKFATTWNRRNHGLNHLRLNHAWLIGLLAGGAILPVYPLIGLLWIGFALANYHYEAIFKYSALLLGLFIFIKTGFHLATHSLKEAITQVGALNSLAVVVIALSVFWISLDHLQKQLSEATFKTFLWLNLLCSFGWAVLYFVEGT